MCVFMGVEPVHNSICFVFYTGIQLNGVAKIHSV